MAKAKETQAASTATAPVVNSLFSTALDVDESKFKRRNLPQMVKGSDIPIGGGFSAEIVDVVDSPVSTVKGNVLWLKNAQGQEFTFACTGDIRNSLAPGKTGDDVAKALKANVGKTIVVKRTADKAGSKKQIRFDVYTN